MPAPSDGPLVIAPTFKANDANLAVVSAKLDGAPHTSGAMVASEGNHTLVVTAVDAAGQVTMQKCTFVIDLTPPVVTIEAKPGAFARGPSPDRNRRPCWPWRSIGNDHDRGYDGLRARD